MTALAPLSATTQHTEGQPTGPAVLLVHGFASTGERDFSALAAALRAAGRVTCIVDLPGHGATPGPSAAADATTTNVVRALVDVVDSMPGDEVDVVGYSLGARLSWELPAASGKPVRRLVLGGISPGDPFATLDYAQLHALLDTGAQPSDPMTGMMGGMVAAQGERAKGVARLMEGLGSEAFAPDASAPSVPTLFLAGDADQMAQGVGALAELVPGSRVTRVPGDHLGALASPEFRDAVVEFLTA